MSDESVSPSLPDDTPNPAPLTREELEEAARRAIFATHIAYGSAIPDALRGAGYSSQSLALGWTLLNYPEVRQAIDQHRAYIRDKQSRTVAELVEQLDRDREFAIETRQAAVAVAATMAQAKLLGVMDPMASLKSGQKRLVITWGGEDQALVEDSRVIEMEMDPSLETAEQKRTGTDAQ